MIRKLHFANPLIHSVTIQFVTYLFRKNLKNISKSSLRVFIGYKKILTGEHIYQGVVEVLAWQKYQAGFRMVITIVTTFINYVTSAFK